MRDPPLRPRTEMADRATQEAGPSRSEDWRLGDARSAPASPRGRELKWRIVRLKKQVREIRQEMSQRIAGMQALLKSADALDDDSRRAIIKALRE